MRRLHYALTCLSWLLACQAQPPERFNPFPTSSLTQPADFCTRVAPSMCDFAARCDPADRAALDAAGDCTHAAEQRCLRRYATEIAAVTSARGAWTPARAELCLGAWANRACDSDEAVSCSGIFAGASQQGDGCTLDGECGLGMMCSAANAVQCGVCIRRALRGEPCFGPHGCQTGLRCAFGKCAPPLGLGEGCLPSDNACAEGYACGGRARTTTCEVVVGEGGSCDKAECVRGTSCVSHDGKLTCVTQAAAGEACSTDNSEHPVCRGAGVTLACVSGRCEALTVLQSGAACDDENVCAGNLGCKDGTCQPKATVGMPCGDDAGVACLESLCVNGTCLAPSVAGDPCVGGRCVGLDCVNGTCGLGVCDGGVAFDAGLNDGGASP